ncbi:hypothetical protein R1sor_024583 [Riccia sorocarpa]|uniref:Uncharacterized protein n=1 Tax=Riccia sorocarpa TaxID=122646 RepID=A0ABD3GT52_9MARC
MQESYGMFLSDEFTSLAYLGRLAFILAVADDPADDLCYLRSFVDHEVIGCSVIDTPNSVSPSKIELVIQHKRTRTKFWMGGKDKENPLNVWVDDDPIPYEFFLDWFLRAPNGQADVKIQIKEFYAIDMAFLPNTWRGNFRLKLDWDGKSVVLGDLCSDVASDLLPNISA